MREGMKGGKEGRRKSTVEEEKAREKGGRE